MNEQITVPPSPFNQPRQVLPTEHAGARSAYLGDAIACVPAYSALFVAIGAGCYALSTSLSLSGISAYLWYALVINLLISFGLQCGNAPVKKLCGWGRVLSLVFVPVLTLVLNSAVMSPLDAEAAVNEMVALLIGGVTVMSILAIGASFANHTVPIAAPLVPALSFFGLLNSLSVNAVTQVCFIIFAAAAIYLVAYEKMLGRSSNGLDGLDRLERDASQSKRRHAVAVGRTASRYFVACSVWFGLFLAASALLYYPIDIILPRLIGDPWTRTHRNRGAAATDWRGSTDTVLLRGGYISLSDSVIMQVTMKGVPPSLWRGRVYEKYSGSRWEVNEKKMLPSNLGPLKMNTLAIPTPDTPFTSRANSVNLMHTGDVIGAFIEPEDAPFKNLFFPGRAMGILTSQEISQVVVDSDGVVVLPGWNRMVWPYQIQARLPEENPAALLQAPGLGSAALTQWRADVVTAPTLELLPGHLTARNKIREIAAQIEEKATAAGRPLITPYQKGIAIRDFLTSGYTYSLASPPVPMNEDAVVFFLTNSRQGACDMFASAAVLLLRAMDVPARLATGYLAAENTDASTAAANNVAANNAAGNVVERGNGDDTGTFRSRASKAGGVETKFPLRERDAHAWVEYYIPGAGWLTMDPTEGTRTNEVPIQTQIAQLLRLPQLNLSWQLLALPAIGVLLLLSGILWPRIVRRHTASANNSASDQERMRIAEAYSRAVRLLKRRVPHGAHYTPQEYEAAVSDSSLPLQAQQEFSALTYLSVAARYATAPPVVAQGELETCLQRLQQALK